MEAEGDNTWLQHSDTEKLAPDSRQVDVGKVSDHPIRPPVVPFRTTVPFSSPARSSPISTPDVLKPLDLDEPPPPLSPPMPPSPRIFQGLSGPRQDPFLAGASFDPYLTGGDIRMSLEVEEEMPSGKGKGKRVRSSGLDDFLLVSLATFLV